MKTICLYFQIHQPFRLKPYRFFDMGHDDYYYDDYNNETIVRRIADNCYLPSNKILLELIKKHKGNFKISFSISGTAIDQFQLYAPDVIESFQKLAETNCVEFLGETYAHSLVGLKDENEFKKQVIKHSDKIEQLFGKRPQVFRNTELIYSNQIGHMVDDMGFKAVLTEGAQNILGWKSPNYLYHHPVHSNLKVLLKNYKLSDDIAFRFSNINWSQWPLTAKKYVSWLNEINKEEEIINLFMDYETFGEHQKKEIGIFSFLQSLPDEVFKQTSFSFKTPFETSLHHKPIAPINIETPISWADENRDLSAWLGNELQHEAFNKLYALKEKIQLCNDNKLLLNWQYLQTSDHFYYMCTKHCSDGDVHAYFNPYENPYAAFMNYMNVLNDFSIRLNKAIENNKSQTSKHEKTVKQLSCELV
ncbi:alpha-amylase [Labilibacter sediminis]|nr:alpha-amylase [Labilibacter sediminis]